MALKRYITVIDDDNQTRTIASDVTGMLFNFLIYNNHNETDTNQPEVTLKIIVDDNELIIFKKLLDKNETLTWKPEISLNGNDIKIYSTLKDVNVVTQVLQ